MSKFVINKTETGYVFHLKASNSETIATSEVYSALESCEKGIASVQKNAPVAAVEDQTVEGFETAKHPKFEIYMDKGGAYRFRLTATNGQNIAASQGYTAKESCKNGIDSVRKNAPVAEIVKPEKE